MKPAKIICGLFVAALLIRLAAVWFAPEPHLGTNAEIAYLGGAHHLVEGRGFRDPAYPVFTPPLYAVLIAASLYLFHDAELPVRIAQAAADSLTVVILYLITWQLLGLETALLASIALSIYPFSIYAVTYIGPETFFTLMLSIFVLLSIYAIRYGHLRYYVSAGLVLGLATLTRGTTLYYPLVFLLPLFLLRRVSRATAPQYVAFCLAFAVVILPWSLRNYVVLDDFIPVATAGSNLLPACSEKFMTIPEKVKEWPHLYEMMQSRGIKAPPRDSKPSERDGFLMKAGLEYCKTRLANDPLSFGPLIVKKFLRLWYATESGENHTKIIAVNMLIYPFALYGLGLAWYRRQALTLLLLAPVGYFISLHWISFPLFRYMLPVMPYVISFAAFGIIELAPQILGRGLITAPATSRR